MADNSYEAQFRHNFSLLCGNAPGLSKAEFMEILATMPSPPSTGAIEASFNDHSDDGRCISCDCMLEAGRELSSNPAFIATTLVQAIERIQWKKLFTLVDEDGSGKVDVMELKSFVDALATAVNLKGYTAQDAGKLIKELGTDEIDFETFMVVARRLTRGTNVITVADKVEEAKRAVRERKATALNLFQARVLGSMLRRRGNTVKMAAPPPNLAATAGPPADHDGDDDEPAPVTLEAAGLPSLDDNAPRPEQSRRMSPPPGADGNAENNLMTALHPHDKEEILRFTSADPSVPLPPTTAATEKRIDAALQYGRSSRVMSVLNLLCGDVVQQQQSATASNKPPEPSKVAAALHVQCQKIAEAVNGSSGTLLEMQRAAVDRIVKEGNEFLEQVHNAKAAEGKKVGDVSVPGLKLGDKNNRTRSDTQTSFADPNDNGGGDAMRPRARSRAQTIFENSFGKDVELLRDIAKEKLATVLEARREIGQVQEDTNYAVSQIVAPRNKIVESAMMLIPHARSSAALAKAIRAFEHQTQELQDMLALFKVFSSDGSSSGKEDADSSSSRNGASFGGFGAGSMESLDNAGGAVSAGGGEELSIVQLLKAAADERWGEHPPTPMSEAAAEAMQGATIQVAFVTDLFKKLTPTQWMRRLSDVAIELSHAVRALQASFLRDRAVQTPTELLISVQNFPVNFSLRGPAGGHNPNADNEADKNNNGDNSASLREKRRLALAHARIRRNLIADVTRAAESVDLLLRRYITAGVIVPDNFGRVLSTDPEKSKRHTFRFGTRLVELTPTDDQRLAVHVGAGNMYFDEYCEKNTVLEMARLQREEKRNRERNNVSFSPGSRGHHDYRSGSAMSGPGGGSRSASSQTQGAVVEFTVRSGSPVNVVPFPWLSEGRSASAALVEAQRARSPSQMGMADSRSASRY